MKFIVEVTKNILSVVTEQYVVEAESKEEAIEKVNAGNVLDMDIVSYSDVQELGSEVTSVELSE